MAATVRKLRRDDGLDDKGISTSAAAAGLDETMLVAATRLVELFDPVYTGLERGGGLEGWC